MSFNRRINSNYAIFILMCLHYLRCFVRINSVVIYRLMLNELKHINDKADMNFLLDDD
jgi:hypothetical protein